MENGRTKLIVLGQIVCTLISCTGYVSHVLGVVSLSAFGGQHVLAEASPGASGVCCPELGSVVFLEVQYLWGSQS